MGKLYNALDIFSVISILEGRILMNKNNLEEIKIFNKQSETTENSSSTGANMSSMNSVNNSSTLEETKNLMHVQLILEILLKI